MLVVERKQVVRRLRIIRGQVEGLERMIEEGYSLYIEATAAKEGEEVALQFGFPIAIRHTRCTTSGAPETE